MMQSNSNGEEQPHPPLHVAIVMDGIGRVAVDYSARDAVLRAARHLVQRGGDRTECSFEEFADLVALVDHGRPGVSPVDVFIRTGGEQRLSDFLLWESAYAELFFRPE